jgi:hypothetical protein
VTAYWTPRARQELIREFREALNDASAERPRRQRMMAGPDGNPEPEWVAFERDIMTAKVNELRHATGRPPIAPARLLRAERQATGHSDYVLQFALGCTDLVMGP